MAGKVINLHKEAQPPTGILIDGTTEWGGPQDIEDDLPAEEFLKLYREWLWDNIKDGFITLEQLAWLKNRVLCCWCKPDPCHGDILLKAAIWAEDQLDKQGFFERMKEQANERRSIHNGNA